MKTINNVPTEIEWRVYRGDTSVLTIFLKDENGKPLTDINGFYQPIARRYPTDAEALATLNSWWGVGMPIQNEQRGPQEALQIMIPWQSLTYPTDNFGVPLDPNQVPQPFAWGKEFYFDLQLSKQLNNNQSAQITVLKVKVVVESDVTRGQGL